MINFFKITDWPIKKFLIVILTLQVLLWGSVSLDLVGLKIPILRQLVCFIYLTFVPGIITLRVLRLHRLGSTENLLYSVGLSLSILMLIGFLMSIYYPLLGITGPITIIPLLITVSFIVLVLCSLCYIIDKDFSDPNSLYLNNKFSVPSLFLLLIPILTIIGTYLMNFYENNSLLMIIIFLLSLIIILVSLDIIPGNLYPLAIFTTSFSLLFHESLISKYIFGWDIQIEYYFANRIISQLIWNPTTYSDINAMLSIVVLAPFYSILANLDLTWVFKIVYPALFSLMPLGLYLCFKKQTTDKIAFMAVFAFISFNGFYTVMLQLARQQIAEYFFVLIILVIIQNKYDVSNRILLILFSYSLIVSHYGLSYIFIISFICSLLLLLLYEKYSNKFAQSNLITFSFILSSSILLFAWYIHISSSSPFEHFIELLENIAISFLSDLFNPDKTESLYIISKPATTFLHGLEKYMHLLIQLYISVGLFYTVFYMLKNKSRKYLEFNNQYLFSCVTFFLMLIAAVLVPVFSSSLNTSRLYQIGLILLTPFSVIGGIIILKALSKIILKFLPKKDLQLNTKKESTLPIKILSLFFALFLLFNTGWIYEIAADTPTSISLNNTLDYPKFNDKDNAGKEWLYKEGYFEGNKGTIYADSFRIMLLANLFSQNIDFPTVSIIPSSISNMNRRSYIYFSTYNIDKNKILISQQKGVNTVIDYVNLDTYIHLKNQIYNNGGSQIYCS